jgi:hypothetical protein
MKVIKRKISEERSWHYTKDEFPKNTEHIRDVIETPQVPHDLLQRHCRERGLPMNWKKVIKTKSVRASEVSQTK